MKEWREEVYTGEEEHNNTNIYIVGDKLMKPNLERLGMAYEQDIFYSLKGKSVKSIKEILKWANKNSLQTNVTMLEVRKSAARTNSDKDFNTVLDLVDEGALNYFVIILRKQMNLFGILTNEKVFEDVLEIGIRGIDVGSKEYFISIYLDKKYIEILNEKHGLTEK